VNGETVPVEMEKGYAAIERTWHSGDMVALELPMTVQRVLCDERVETNIGKAAIERGPLVYCVEGVDNGGQALDLAISENAKFEIEWMPELLGGVNGIRIAQSDATVPEILAIPYYAWAHRGVGEMAVWLSRE